MAEAKAERLSFAGGEIGRNLRFSADLAVYQTAVQELENFVVLVERGATRRPGTRFVVQLPDQAERGKLVPFRLSSSDYYMLVINAGRSRFLRNGGIIENPDTTPYELVVPWPEAELPLLRPASAGNTLMIASGVRPIQEITRNDHTDWTCADFVADNGPVDIQNLDQAVTVKASAVTGAGVTLTGVGAPFKPGWVGQVIRLDEPDLSAISGWRANETAMTVGSKRRWDGNVYEVVSGTDTGPNPPVHTEGNVNSGSGFVTWRYLHSSYGFVRITGYTSANAATGTVLSRLPDSVVSGPTYRWSPPAWSLEDGFPDVLAFSTPRMLFARGDLMWLSGVDDLHDLEVTAEDDGAIALRLRSPDASLIEIKWVLPSGVMVVGTSDIEWQLRAPNVFDALTPSNIRPIPESSEGSAAQIPALVDGGPVFTDKAGTRLFWLKFDKQGQGAQRLDTEEISIWARHIIKRGVVGIAWQKSPQRVLWIVDSAGGLSGLTFMPAQKVLAWHRHPMTNAFVEDIAVIPSTETGEDEVYLVVRREIDGETCRYVELLQPFFEPEDPDAPTAVGAWYVDCGLRRAPNGSTVETITNLAHLEGETVAVFADGAMQSSKTVVDGAIELDAPADEVLVGLPIVARILDLPRNAQAQTGTTKAEQKTSREVVIDLIDAGGGKIRTVAATEDDDGSEGPWEPIIETGDLDYDELPPLRTRTLTMVVEGDSGAEAQIEIVCDDAMPFTIAGLSPVIDVEEED